MKKLINFKKITIDNFEISNNKINVFNTLL